ncbi:hypothetical protein DSECCO2_282570 [anaerobic digester metagenome]|jgi:hypothetical protein
MISNVFNIKCPIQRYYKFNKINLSGTSFSENFRHLQGLLFNHEDLFVFFLHQIVFPGIFFEILQT